MAEQNELIELEIAAFQGPHIKRARMVLAATGVLYVILGYLDYGDIAKARERVHTLTAAGVDLGDAPHLVNMALAVAVAAVAGGIANVALAVLGGTKTMIVFYVAAAIFIGQSALNLYVSGGAMLTSLLWWLIAIVLGMGFMAAFKAEQLRKRPVPARG